MQTKYKATLALALSVLGFFLSSPYAEAGFAGGLIYHGFLAAMVGGLADWFAVTALFRKPLGISYRTEILRRNRPRIMQALVDFASADLLNVENIMAVVREQDMARMMMDYLTQRGGRERLKLVLNEVLRAAARTMDIRDIARQLVPVFQGLLKNVAIEKLAVQFLTMLGEARCSRQLLPALARIGRQVLAAPVVQALLQEHITMLRQQYEGKSFGRSFLIGVLNLSDEKLLRLLNQRLQGWLDAMESGESQAYAQAAAWLEQSMALLGQEPRLLESLRQWKNQRIDALHLEDSLADWLEQTLKAEDPDWLKEVDQFVDDKVELFIANEAWQKRYDAMAKNIIEHELTVRHDVIADLIRTRLDELSDDNLIEFIETRIADDLQMIRINGSIVGSLVGMLLYTIVFCVERVCG